MTCNFDEMLLYEYLDNLLDANEKLEVNNHLSTCSSCRKKLSEIKLMYYELDHLDEVEIPEELATMRASFVLNAFDEKEKVSPIKAVSSGLKKTKTVLNNAPVIGTLMPTKEKFSTASKHVYEGSKKILSKETKKPKKSKKSFKQRVGGLL